MSIYKCKSGFTLAEILLTLGIIGVVAAITIPGLITEYQKRATVTKLKRAISVINQAYKQSYEDNGDLTADLTNKMGAESYFHTYWEPYIKILTYCSSWGICGYDTNTPFSQATGEHDTMGITGGGRVSFYTMDGFIYMIHVGAIPGVPLSVIYVDINGGAKPNRYGKDVFILNRIADGGGVQPNGYDTTDNKVKVECTVGRGLYCAEYIRRSGWRIEKDYPW